ncbi:polysaccharide biosynthesis/export family protein [Gemmatimonas sp.]|uniref:polysaccharide biosynthesis/export family protein n=1 Tax=Gemmatimonas sp. TaxID=1962908 RepID=UPI00356A2F8C
MRGVIFTIAAFSATPGFAQEAPLGGAQRATRAALAERVAQLEQESGSGRLSGSARNRATSELAAVRMRLQQGDFRVGDRFVITLRQDSVRSDTASVRDSLKVSVVNLPDVSLAGVLRAELDERMTAHVARYLRGVSVRTSVLTRVAILGAVRMPGFYYVSPDRPVSDVIMIAGGPVELANLNEFEISRGSTKLVKAKDSKRVIKEGRTLEQLDVQSGDEVRIPSRKKINWQLFIQSLLLVSTLLFAGLQFLQWYYGRQNQ